MLTKKLCILQFCQNTLSDINAGQTWKMSRFYSLTLHNLILILLRFLFRISVLMFDILHYESIEQITSMHASTL